jgi:hypothetical protein
MQANFLYALNGIATVAQDATPPDMNAMAFCQDVYEQAIRSLGDTYDTAASSTSSSAIVLQTPPPFSTSGVSGSYDSQQQVASTLTIGTTSVPNIRVLGG